MSHLIISNYHILLKTSYLFNVSQRLGVPAQLLPLVLTAQADVSTGLSNSFCRGGVAQGAEGDIKDHLVVPDQELHYQGLIRIIDQGGQGNFGIRLPWFDQRRAEDDAQVTGGHLILSRMFRHPGENRAF